MAELMTRRQALARRAATDEERASAAEPICAGLQARRVQDATIVGFEGRERPFVRLRPLDGRLRVELCLLGDRAFDLSHDPKAIDGIVREQAFELGADANAWHESLRSWLRHWAATHLPLTPPGPPTSTLVALLGRLAFPLVGPFYDAGVAPLAQVPRWAGPALAQPTIGQAARTAFGASSSRPVARGLGASLHPPASAGQPATVALMPLATALAVAPRLGPDQLAWVLSHREPWEPPHRWPTPDELATARRGLRLLDGTRTWRIVRDALEHGRPGRLLDTLTLVHLAARDLRPPLPNRLEELAAAARLALGHGTTGPAPQAAVVPPALAGQPPPPAPTRPRAAPAARHGRPGAEFAYPAALWEIDGRRVGTLRFGLPAGPGDLTAWGRALRNCLGSYIHAVSAGASWVIGIHQEDRLVGCIEIVPTTGAVRQLLGAANAPLPPDVAATIVGDLTSAGVVRA